MTTEKLILTVAGVIVCAVAGIVSWWLENRGEIKKNNLKKENDNEEN